MPGTTNCRQKQQSKLLPSEAQNDVLSFMEAGVFSPAIHGVDQFLANMMVVLRTSGKELHTSNEADTHIACQLVSNVKMREMLKK